VLLSLLPNLNILSRVLGCVTIRLGMDWILVLLTTYTHHSELHVIAALSRICTIYS
jgi:hypothetical protein